MQNVIMIILVCKQKIFNILNLDVHVYVITKNTTNESQTKLRTFQGKQ